MPWSLSDVEKHIKGLSTRQKRVWVKVANQALKRCLERGGERRECEASAIRQANAIAKQVKDMSSVTETQKAETQKGKRVQRYDIAEVRGDFYRDEDGFLTVPVAIAKPGALPYRQQDGSVRYELKHPVDLFAQETIDSAKGRPVTDEHPDELVTTENAKKYIKGITHADVRVQDGMLYATETVFDKDLIDRILNGEKGQVSIGFTCELVDEEGTYEGQAYQARQRNIRINHLAHTTRGRAGEDVAVKLDSASLPEGSAVQVRADYVPPNPSDYGIDETGAWEDPTPQLPDLREASAGEKREIMRLYAWARSNNPDEITNKNDDLKLPHHRRNGTVVWGGVRAAMAALLGARGGVDIPAADRRAVYNHLARHYEEDFDREAPEYHDSLRDLSDEELDGNTEGSKDAMVTITLDGKEFGVPKAVAEYLQKVEYDLKEAGDAVKDLKAERDDLKGRLDAKEDEIKALQEKVANDGNDNGGEDAETDEKKFDDAEFQRRVDEAISRRLAFIDKIRTYLPGYDHTGKSERDMQVDVIKIVNEKFDAEGKSDEYVQARFDATVEFLDREMQSSVGRNQLRYPQKDSNESDKIAEMRRKRLNMRK